jgi:transposase
MDDAELERRLFTPPSFEATPARAQPVWNHVHKELKRRGVTLQLLWEEYRADHVDGYGYSRFCDLYRDWRKIVSATMRQTHAAGEKLFVDWAGDTVPVFDTATGEEGRAHIFVAVLGASNYTYAEARWSEALPEWIGAHVNAFAAIGGVPAAVVCDNLKAGVTATCRYEPGINRTYQDLAAHYDTAILPTRPRKPRDKAKVEVAVLVATRWIIAKLRNRRFFSLFELNAAIRELVTALNDRVTRHLGASRRMLFEELERSELKPLPAEPYTYAEWRLRRVGLDYHVDIDGHYYSVPYRLLKEQVEARITQRTIELFHKGERVACHMRGGLRGRHTTLPEHMPSSHRRYAGWTIDRIRRDAAAIGPNAAALTTLILESRPHPEQGFRACLGILRLARHYGAVRLEAACARGLDIGARSYGSINSILQNGLDRRPPPRAAEAPELPLEHANIRGPRYYH